MCAGIFRKTRCRSFDGDIQGSSDPLGNLFVAGSLIRLRRRDEPDRPLERQRLGPARMRDGCFMHAQSLETAKIDVSRPLESDLMMFEQAFAPLERVQGVAVRVFDATTYRKHGLMGCAP